MRRRPLVTGSASSATSRSAATSRPTSLPSTTTRSSTPRRQPTASSGSRARNCPAPMPRPSSSPGTTPTRTSPITSSTSRAVAVVIGNGNVAADVARMLALTEEELRADGHRRSRDRGARRHRGDERSSCSAAADRPRPRSPTPRCASSASWRRRHRHRPGRCELDRSAPRTSKATTPTRQSPQRRLFSGFAERPPEGKPRRVVLRFLAWPVEIHGDDRVEAIRSSATS